MFLAMSLTGSMMAEGDHTVLKINLANGKVVMLWLGDAPVISHEYNKKNKEFELTVVAKDATATFPVSEVQKAEFAEIPAGMNELTIASDESFVFRDGKTAQLRGVRGKVNVYSIDGKKMAAKITILDEESVNVDMSALQDGIYMISVQNGRTYKVVKR